MLSAVAELADRSLPTTEARSSNPVTGFNKQILKPFFTLKSTIIVYRCLGTKNNLITGSGCGSVGRAVASNTRGPQFESSHRQEFIMNIFIVNC